MSKLKKSRSAKAAKRVHSSSVASARVHRKAHSAANATTIIASMEKQIAVLEEKIALLEGSGQCSKNTDHCPLPTDHCSDHCSLPTAHSARATLAAPANLLAVPVGSSFLRVSWNTVVGAKGYLLQYSSDANFVNDTNAIIVDAPATAITLSGLKPDTMYHVKVKSLADTGDSDSNFTMAYLVRTGVASGNDNPAFLQGWLSDLQNANQSLFAILPEIENGTQTPGQRRRLLGSGVRRYGYFDKVSDTATEYPQFWPLGNDETENMKDLIREIEALRNLLVFFESGARLVTDRLLVIGDEVFRLANVYYRGVREAVRQQMPDAEAVFQRLRLFWHRPRRSAAETTKKRALRNARALQRGTRVGKVTFENEADTVIPGKKRITDETQPKCRIQNEECRMEESEEEVDS